MKSALWACVMLSLINAFMFPDFITLGYIAILLFIIYIYGKNDIKKTGILMMLLSIIGVILAIINFNLISIFTSIILIISVASEYIKVSSQKKFDESLGISTLQKRDKEERPVSGKFNKNIVKNSFDKFTQGYDKKNYMVQQKYDHSLNVAKNAEYIAKRLGLDTEGVYLAYVIGLIHDVGRFEQIKINNSLMDNELLDHGNYGEELLKSGLLRQLVPESKYDDIIFKAIRNHNKHAIDESFSEDEKLYSAILRDADKLDIFENLSKGEFKDFYNIDKDLEFSQDILNEIEKKHTIDYDFVNNNLDLVILRLAMIYDINYPCTLSVIKQNDYLNKYISLIDISDNNKETLKRIVDEIHKDINNQIK